MSRGSVSAAGVLAGLFLIAGVGFGLVGAVTTGWAETAFATDAGGDAERFGPVFVAQLYFVTSATALVVAPLLAVPLGLAFGTRARTAGDGALVCGLGSVVGGAVFGLAAVGVVVASQGAAADQAHGLGETLWPLAVSSLCSGILGAVAGMVGTQLG